MFYPLRIQLTSKWLLIVFVQPTGVIYESYTSFCFTDVCQNTSPYLINNQPVICNQSQPIACPQGYECKLYPQTGSTFCCSTASCPVNTSPFLETDGRVRSCTPGVITTCPSSYDCVIGQNGQYQCCSRSISSKFY